MPEKRTRSYTGRIQIVVELVEVEGTPEEAGEETMAPEAATNKVTTEKPAAFDQTGEELEQVRRICERLQKENYDAFAGEAKRIKEIVMREIQSGFYSNRY